MPTAPGLARSPISATPSSSPRSTIATRRTTRATAASTRPAWREYSDLDFNRYSFRAVDLLAQQFVPIFDKKRVFAVQAAVRQRRIAGSGQQVPFYFKPTLGGSNQLRGYNDYRFRDDAVVYFNAEYRWEAFSGLDMALFYDWGSSRRTSTT